MPRRCLVIVLMLLAVSVSRGAENGVGDKPYLGWSSWTLQSTTAPGYGRDWLTAERVLAQAAAMKKTLGAHGYIYINIDSFWSDAFDENGRPIANPKTFPDGIAALARHLHADGQKVGLYTTPGVDDRVYDRNPLIAGTNERVRDIVAVPRRPGNAFGGGHAIDYSKPGAHAYIESIVGQFAEWGVDFLKLDGMTPGSDYKGADVDTRADAAAWGEAVRKCGRPIWLTFSWGLDRGQAALWQKYANAFRINGDVERYGPTLCGWEQVKRRFDAQPKWRGVAGPGKGWCDLDSVIVANGDLDGLTRDEKRTMVTFWALAAAPLYVGGDLTKIDDLGRSLLTNDDVLAIDQAGRPATQVVGGDGTVWATTLADGTMVVGLFNLADDERSVGVDRAALDLNGAATARDVWAGTDLGPVAGRLEFRLPPHAVRLIALRQTTPATRP